MSLHPVELFENALALFNQSGATATIVYKNWKGEVGLRRIKPIQVFYGATEWHPAAQWLLKALDVEKNAERDFALGDIQSWECHASDAPTELAGLADAAKALLSVAPTQR